MRRLPFPAPLVRASLFAASLFAALPAAAREPAIPSGLTLDGIVLLMRHGVRPPTKSPPMSAGVARKAWPKWGVPPGHLTMRGEKAVRLIALYDRAAWTAVGLLPKTGCARIRIVADSDQRTIATARAYAEALAPTCAVAIAHKPQDVADPLFSPIDEKAVAFDAVRARQVVVAGAGPSGIAGEEARLRPVLARLDAILCGRARPKCGVAREPSGLAPAETGKRPKLTGALDRGSTAAQILLLEYADAKSMGNVGWGRAKADDIARLSELHAVEFRLLARPRYVARANLALLAPAIAAAVGDDDAPAVTMISGHDTNVASLAGLLDLHWQVPGLAADDPSPGGAIVFQRFRDASGQRYVRALYRSQTISQIRALTPPTRSAPYVAVLPIEGCAALGVAGLCTLSDFTTALTR